MSRLACVAASLVVLTVACGGGPEGTGSSSSGGGASSGASGGGSKGGSSGAGSSGTSACEAVCSTGASVAFDEPNDDGRLDGALVEACHNDRCASGTLSKPDGGAGYKLALDGGPDAGAIQIEANVGVATSPNALRFRVRWTLSEGTPAGAVDGDLYTVSARAGGAGAELFSRSFTAVYAAVSECGTTCKFYEGS